MSLIDQRILIEAPVEAIWSYVADPAMLTKWNRAYKQVSVLTTKSTGAGSRRRCVGANGKTVVEEVTAWLEHIGYEYHVIDGPFESFRGRFRLQAIPDGTIVNWTVEYRLRGPMSGLRNLTTFRRHQEDLMAESLRQLRRVIEASGARLDKSEHAKYAMQSGPSVEARASRSLEHNQAITGRTSAMKPVSVGEDDLPELPIQAAAEQPATSATGGFVPSFAEPGATTPGAPVKDDDTKPRPPLKTRDTATVPVASDTSPKVQARPSSEETVPVSMVAPPRVPEPMPDTQTIEINSPTPPDTLPERIPTSPMPAVHDSDDIMGRTPLPITKGDTGEVSIWDVFGVARPSDRAQSELEAVIASIQRRAESPDAPEAQATEPFAAVSSFAAPVIRNGFRRSRAHKTLPPVRALHRHAPHQKTRVAVKPPQLKK